MIIEQLQYWASIEPGRRALVSGEHTLTYGELEQRVSHVADLLQKEQINSLALDLPNSINWVIADLAAIKAGVTNVPVPAFFSAEQRQHVLKAAAVDAVLNQSGKEIYGLEDAAVSRSEWASSQAIGQKITFTSGSTGTPKGVILDYAALEQVAGSIVAAMDSINVRRHLCLLPLATLLENVAGIYAPLIKGIETVVPPAAETGLEGSSGLDIEKFAACLETHQPDSIILVPQLLMALITLTELGIIKPDYLQMVAVGGGKVASSLLEKSHELGIPVYEGYGLSEACSVTTLNLPGQTRAGSVGKVLPHAEVRISETGELEVRGTLMQGYLGDAPHTDTWLATGDEAEIDEEGYVFIKGRKKNMFITAFGRNVNPEWVEAEIGQHPSIAQILVDGEGQAWNLALVWPRFGASHEDISAIISAANQKLPDYARVADFVLMEDPLPGELITANGRLKRAAALAACAEVIAFNYQKHQGATHGVL